ncbi:MAG: hypothetical protein H6797_01910 [Candidatus Nomurabacteria bacterium]|nr:MAG: hypothetical protein H6797_01910 [Candidatus Nomurabacteria bacterium]
MAIHREPIYYVSYESRTPISDHERSTYSQTDCSDEDDPTSVEERPQHDDAPKIAYGCNMLGEMGKCALRQQIENDRDGKPVIRLLCKGIEPTHSRAEAEKRENTCRKIHTLIRDNLNQSPRHANPKNDDAA